MKSFRYLSVLSVFVMLLLLSLHQAFYFENQLDAWCCSTVRLPVLRAETWLYRCCTWSIMIKGPVISDLVLQPHKENLQLIFLQLWNKIPRTGFIAAICSACFKSSSVKCISGHLVVPVSGWMRSDLRPSSESNYSDRNRWSSRHDRREPSLLSTSRWHAIQTPQTEETALRKMKPPDLFISVSEVQSLYSAAEWKSLLCRLFVDLVSLLPPLPL